MADVSAFEFFSAVREHADPSSLFTEYLADEDGFTVRYGIGGWDGGDEFIAWGDVVWEHTKRPNPFAKDLHDIVHAPGVGCVYSGAKISDAEDAFVAAVEDMMFRKEEEANGGRPV